MWIRVSDPAQDGVYDLQQQLTLIITKHRWSLPYNPRHVYRLFILELEPQGWYVQKTSGSKLTKWLTWLRFCIKYHFNTPVITSIKSAHALSPAFTMMCQNIPTLNTKYEYKYAKKISNFFLGPEMSFTSTTGRKKGTKWSLGTCPIFHTMDFLGDSVFLRLFG